MLEQWHEENDWETSCPSVAKFYAKCIAKLMSAAINAR